MASICSFPGTSAFDILSKPTSAPTPGPKPFLVNPSSLNSLFARTAAFLPEIAKANEKLAAEVKAGQDVNIENTSEVGEHISMVI